MSIAARFGARAGSREDTFGFQHFATFSAAFARDAGFGGTAAAVGPRPAVAAMAAADETWVAARLGASAEAAAVRPTQPEPLANGGSARSTAMAATGDQSIDALLSTIKWDTDTLTYADPNAASDYQPGYDSDGDGDGLSAQNDGFSRLSAQERVALHFSLSASIYTQPAGAAGFGVAGFTALDLTYSAADGAANIRVANSSDPGTSYAYYPDAGIYAADAWMGTSARSPTAGNYSWYTMMHEIGHTLGLKHGHETQGYGALPANVDSHEYSIMTYKSYIGSDISSVHWEQWGAPQTFMMLDIAALQAMYGAEFDVNAGNTTYRWDPTSGATYVDGELAIEPGGNRVFLTVWDGDGTDTYDLSNYASNLELDLDPGSYSDFNSGQSAYLGGGPNDGYARGNVFNALLYQGDLRSLIENANGGSGDDRINGNQANNALRGNAGADTLYGQAGNDALYGGSGDDTLTGGLGNDRLFGSAGVDLADYSGTAARVRVDLADTGPQNTLGAGVDRLTDIEGLRGSAFNDLLSGDAAANLIDGGAGNDTLRGAAGDDILIGGLGRDTLAGGGGRDIFAFAAADTPNEQSDLVSDFVKAVDRIDLSAISEGIGEALSFLGDAAFSGADGEFRYRISAGDTRLMFDLDGDTVADLTIRFTGEVLFAATDFILT